MVEQQMVSKDEIYRQYGEAMVQLEIAQNRVIMLKQAVNQTLNQPLPTGQPMPIQMVPR